MGASLRELAGAGATRVRVHYADIVGTTRAKVIPLDLLEEAAGHGVNFCVATFAIDHQGVMPDGTGLRDEVLFRDMQVIPDLDTLRAVPWERDTALCLGDCHFDGAPLPASPRGILKRAIAEAESHGWRVKCGHELEFFLLRRNAEGGFDLYQEEPGTVYRLDPRVDREGVIRAIEDAVRGIGLPFVAANQEYDPSQWEINCRFDDALQAADDAHLLKVVVKEIAAMHGLVATFIGRPVDGRGTSGYHIHLSIWDDEGRNVFDDPPAPRGLAPMAGSFVAGVIEHGRGMAALLCPTVNAYKRIAAQELAPYFADWGDDNRSTMVRIPVERGKASRVEIRSADGSANPYLAAAAVLFAGMDGVDRELDPGPPTEAVYEPPVERATLPRSLSEALDAFEADGFVRERFSDQFAQCFLAIKRNEVRRFELAVTDWELREYVNAL